MDDLWGAVSTPDLAGPVLNESVRPPPMGSLGEGRGPCRTSPLPCAEDPPAAECKGLRGTG